MKEEIKMLSNITLIKSDTQATCDVCKRTNTEFMKIEICEKFVSGLIKKKEQFKDSTHLVCRRCLNRKIKEFDRSK